MDNIIPGEIKSVPNSEEILKLLECPCCLEPPIPPIKTCVTGHIICSFCRPRLTKCPICRELYTESRNFPLESIFNACTIACKFWGRGCQQIVPGVKYLDHVKICQYRALCCSHCQESISPVDQYINHLRDKHHAVGYEEERNNYECKNTIEDLNHDMRFPDQYALFDGKYFIASSQIRSQFLFIWLSVVEDFSLNLVDGDPNDDVIIEALKKKVDTSHYSAVIAITPEGHSLPEVKWTIPIYPLQNGDANPALAVNMPVNPTFRGFLTRLPAVTDDQAAPHRDKFSWCFNYSIMKVENNG